MTPQPSLIIKSAHKRAGFSLVELLVVIAIITILLGLSVPAINSMVTAYDLSTATDQVVSTMNLARQDALSLNTDVYIVFFQYKGTTPFEGAAGRFRALQLFQVVNPATGATPPATYVIPANTPANTPPASQIYVLPLTKLTLLSGTVVIADASTQSTLFNSTTNPNLSALSGSSYPQFGGGYNTLAFCFTPSSGTNLNIPSGTTASANYPYLLLCDLKSLASLPTTGPLPTTKANYAVLEVNPLNGITRSFRP